VSVVALEITPRGGPLLGMERRLKGDKSAPLLACRDAFRSLIAEEFRLEAWRPPSGPMRPWKRTRAFGAKPAPAKTLHGGGGLRRAYLGQGAGAIERQTADSITIGVAGSVFPYAVVHRGGSGAVTAALSRRTTKIRVTERQRRYLLFAFGVPMKVGSVIEIPPRPHATRSPELLTRMSAIFGAWAVGRPIPERLVA
jgi:hypothetical protein